jgi:hypothetical protein
MFFLIATLTHLKVNTFNVNTFKVALTRRLTVARFFIQLFDSSVKCKLKLNYSFSLKTPNVITFGQILIDKITER